MAFTLEDFNKIWASTSPLTPYEFSDSNYQQGWNFIGSTPPARQMWDFLQKQNDEKAQWLYNNKLSLSGGTMTGNITLADGGNPLSTAGGTMTGTIIPGFPAFKQSSNEYNVTLAGGSDTVAEAGAKLILYGADSTDTGNFVVQAGNSGGHKQLVGNPNGKLTWGDSNVAVMGTLQNGHGILTGSVTNISIAANGYTQGTVNFGQTYSSAPTVVANCSYGHAHVYVGCYSVTTTGFSYVVSSENDSSFSNEKINWIAIG